MVLVGALYTISWTPMYISGILVYLYPYPLPRDRMYYTTVLLGYSYMCTNPFIYATKFDPVKQVLHRMTQWNKLYCAWPSETSFTWNDTLWEDQRVGPWWNYGPHPWTSSYMTYAVHVLIPRTHRLYVLYNVIITGADKLYYVCMCSLLTYQSQCMHTVLSRLSGHSMVYFMLLTVTVQAVCTYCRNYYYDCIVCHLNRLRMHNAYAFHSILFKSGNVAHTHTHAHTHKE